MAPNWQRQIVRASDRGIPEKHDGLHYYEFMATLSKKRNVKRYFEVGVNAGGLMSRIHAEIAVGVDPEYVLAANIAANKKIVSLIQETSDRFFASRDYHAIAGGPPELSFLDGLHVFDCLLRDFMNTEAICSPNSLICLHDCLPLSETMTIRSMHKSLAASVGTGFEGWWTGDVWKIIPIIQKYRPDLKLILLDCEPTGIACVTNLDPKNTVLRDSYLEIVKEFHNKSSDRAELEAFYDQIEIHPAANVLEEADNGLFFRI